MTLKTTNDIIKHLTSLIPQPRVEPPKPQNSWASLKVGDVLEFDPKQSGEGYSSGPWGSKWSEFARFEVLETTSVGAKLVTLPQGGCAMPPCGSGTFMLIDREWRRNGSGWRKVPKRSIKSEEVSL